MTSNGRRSRKTARWVAWALCVLPLGALADQPFQQSDGISDAASDSAVSPDARSGNADNPMRGARHRQPTDEEWQEASALLRRYSPKRMAAVASLPDGPLKQRLRNFIYGRYLALVRVQDNFPQIFQLQLQRLTIEDNLFDLHHQFVSATGSAKASLRSDMRQQVQALFDNVQQDRQARINRMKMLVAEMQAKKESDAQNRDTLIEEQLRDVIQYGPKAMEREGFLRRNGGGGNTSAPSSGGSSSRPAREFQATTSPD
jgi:hypothetical protein